MGSATCVFFQADITPRLDSTLSQRFTLVMEYNKKVMLFYAGISFTLTACVGASLKSSCQITAHQVVTLLGSRPNVRASRNTLLLPQINSDIFFAHVSKHQTQVIGQKLFCAHFSKTPRTSKPNFYDFQPQVH